MLKKLLGAALLFWAFSKTQSSGTKKENKKSSSQINPDKTNSSGGNNNNSGGNNNKPGGDPPGFKDPYSEVSVENAKIYIWDHNQVDWSCAVRVWFKNTSTQTVVYDNATLYISVCGQAQAQQFHSVTPIEILKGATACVLFTPKTGNNFKKQGMFEPRSVRKYIEPRLPKQKKKNTVIPPNELGSIRNVQLFVEGSEKATPVGSSGMACTAYITEKRYINFGVG